MLILSRGQHDRPEQGVNLLEHVSQLAGQPFTDYPEGVSPVLAELLRGVCEDCRDSFRPHLLQYAQLLVGSLGSPPRVEREAERAWIVADWVVRAQCYVWAKEVDIKPVVKAIKAMEPVRPATAAKALAVIHRCLDSLQASSRVDDWVEHDIPGLVERVEGEATRVECHSLIWAAFSHAISQEIPDARERFAQEEVVAHASIAIKLAIRLQHRRALQTATALNRIEGSLDRVVQQCLAR